MDQWTPDRTPAEANAAARTLRGVAELLVGVVHDARSVGRSSSCCRTWLVRITGLTDVAAEMVRSLAAFPLLDGYGGAPRADVVAVEDLLLPVRAGGHPPGSHRD